MPINKKKPRVAGFGFLIIKLAGTFAKTLFRFKLVVPGDFSIRTERFKVSEWMFRHGSAGDLIVITCNAVVALALEIILKPVDRSLVLLKAFFRLLHVANKGINMLYYFLVFQPFGDAGLLTVSEYDQLNSSPLESFAGLQREILPG